jgi:diguanylate cyclase (GGDEF)-like protein
MEKLDEINNRNPKMDKSKHQGFSYFDKIAELNKLSVEGGLNLANLQNALKSGEIEQVNFSEFVVSPVASYESKIKILENERGIDFLTGLFNRRFLKPRLEKLIRELNYSRDARHSSQVGVVVFLLDLKDLKSFNLGGQSEGDIALKGFADILRNTVRDHDMLFRVGGDEFTVIFSIESEATGADLEKVFDVVVKRMQDATGNAAYTGYAILKKGENKTADELLEIADQMMVHNKALEKKDRAA